MAHNSGNFLTKRYFFSPIEPDSNSFSSYWVRLAPSRVLDNRVGKLRNALRIMLLVSVLLLFFLFSCCLFAIFPSPFHSAPVLYAFFILFFFFFACFLVLILLGLSIGRSTSILSASHIELNQEGVRLHWMLPFFCSFSPLISWERISHISSRVEKNMLDEKNLVDFNVGVRGMSLADRASFAIANPIASGWWSSDRARITLMIDSIASSEDRNRLQFAIKKFLPSYRIDPRVSDDLNLQIKLDSYTDLWFDRLESSKLHLKERALLRGDLLKDGAYRIERELAFGGQATVYEATLLKELPELEELDSGNSNKSTRLDLSDLVQPRTKKDNSLPSEIVESGPVKDNDGLSVVLKEFVLPVDAGSAVRARVLGNIQKEARLWRRLNHPNVVRLLDFFVEDQRAYLAIERAEGQTLKSYIQEPGKLSESEAIELALQMCDMLAYLHRRRPPVIHRDFTPDNLIIETTSLSGPAANSRLETLRGEQSSPPKLKLIDFNVAMQLEAQTTRTVVGKHAYIPPEQFKGKACQQSDIYSMGATLYFLLTGREPEPITVSHPGKFEGSVSAELDRIIAKATCLSLTGRYQSIEELKLDLLALPGSKATVFPAAAESQKQDHEIC